MGYDYSVEGQITVPANRERAALEAIRETLGTSIRTDSVSDALTDVFGRIDFEEVTEEGTAYNLSHGDLRLHDTTDALLRALAPHAVGSIECQGGDGEHWLYALDSGQFSEFRGTVVYPGAENLRFSEDDLPAT